MNRALCESPEMLAINKKIPLAEAKRDPCKKLRSRLRIMDSYSIYKLFQYISA
jgi:hypothetical protein